MLSGAHDGDGIRSTVRRAGEVCVVRRLDTVGRLAVGDDDMLQLAARHDGGGYRDAQENGPQHRHAEKSDPEKRNPRYVTRVK